MRQYTSVSINKKKEAGEIRAEKCVAGINEANLSSNCCDKHEKAEVARKESVSKRCKFQVEM